MQQHNAKITEAKIRRRGHSLQLLFQFKYQCGGQGAVFRVNTDLMHGLMLMLSVNHFRELEGKTVRVRRKEGYHGKAQQIGHPIKDEWVRFVGGSDG